MPCLGQSLPRVRGGGPAPNTANTALWHPLLTWTQMLGWPFSNGNSRAFCDKRGMRGVTKGGPLRSPSSPTRAPLCQAYVHSDILSGQGRDQRLAGTPTECLPAQCGLSKQRAWRVQPPAPRGQQLQAGGTPEVAVCTGVCREKAESVTVRPAYNHLHHSPPWPLQVCSPFLKGQMLVLTESGSRGHTWKANRAPQLVQPSQPSRSMCQALCEALGMLLG